MADCYLAPMKALVLKEEQFVTDANGKRVGVLLDVATYDRLCEAEEELSDIRAYDTARPKVQAELAAGKVISLADYQTPSATRGANEVSRHPAQVGPEGTGPPAG